MTAPQIAAGRALKAALQRQWPQVRWSVRTAARSYYLVDVAWHDGPTMHALRAWCQQWAETNPGHGRWVTPTGVERRLSPAGYAVVIEMITADIPDIPIPRTPDGGLDRRTAFSLTWDRPIKVAGKHYDHPGHVYDVAMVVDLVARDIDLSPAGPGAGS